MLIVHGEKDLIPAADVQAFVERVRAVSSHPVSYAELPGAHHDFDLYESIRSAAVNKAVEQFAARAGAFSDANHRNRQPTQDS
jgi:acetyl esterase/lipase